MPNNFFVELYGEQRVVKKCSRCNKCRHETLHKKEQKNYREPGLNFKNKIDDKLDLLLGGTTNLWVFFEKDELTSRINRDLNKSFKEIQKLGVGKLVFFGLPSLFDKDTITQFAKDAVFFISYVDRISQSLLSLPSGPEIIIVGGDKKLQPRNVVGNPTRPRVFITEKNHIMTNGDRLERDFKGRKMKISRFIDILTENKV